MKVIQNHHLVILLIVLVERHLTFFGNQHSDYVQCDTIESLDFRPFMPATEREISSNPIGVIITNHNV